MTIDKMSVVNSHSNRNYKDRFILIAFILNFSFLYKKNETVEKYREINNSGNIN